MRKNLKEARAKAHMTTKQVAEKLGTSLRNYQSIEHGDRAGNFAIWDFLEDLFGIDQRNLRENQNDD